MLKIGVTYKDIKETKYDPFQNPDKIPPHYTILDYKEGFYQYIWWWADNCKMRSLVCSDSEKDLLDRGMYDLVEVPKSELPKEITPEAIHRIMEAKNIKWGKR